MGVVISQAKQLVGDVKTRWNSTYLMLLRIQTLRPALEQFMLDEAELPSTTSSWSHSNEWAMIDSMVALLGPFYRFTELMCSNKMSAALAIV